MDVGVFGMNGCLGALERRRSRKTEEFRIQRFCFELVDRMGCFSALDNSCSLFLHVLLVEKYKKVKFLEFRQVYIFRIFIEFIVEQLL